MLFFSLFTSCYLYWSNCAYLIVCCILPDVKLIWKRGPQRMLYIIKLFICDLYRLFLITMLSINDEITCTSQGRGFSVN